jgi:peptidoglycan/LPS O-acetylase OafA/YrhL
MVKAAPRDGALAQMDMGVCEGRWAAESIAGICHAGTAEGIGMEARSAAGRCWWQDGVKLEEERIGRRLPELDGLRGLAISLVIAAHSLGAAEHAPLGVWAHRALAAFSAGWSGVDLFFVLSGFLIGGILLDVRDAPHYFRTFYVRRFFRIFPIYYSWILIYAVLVFAALWFAPGRYALDRRDVMQIPYHLLFLQNMVYAFTPLSWRWFGPTWSLAVEEQFYLMAPPLIRFFRFRTVVTVLVATVCLAPVLRLVVLAYGGVVGSYAVAFATPCRADTLAVGVLAAIAWRQEAARTFLETHAALMRRILLGLFAGVLILVWWLAHPVSLVTVGVGYTWLAAFYACLLLTVISQTKGRLAGIMRWNVLRRLGTISYCLYLIHATIHYLGHEILLGASPGDL